VAEFPNDTNNLYEIKMRPEPGFLSLESLDFDPLSIRVVPFSFLFLFLSAAASAASFRFFTASACRRLTSRSSGIGGLEGWHLRLTPCKTQSNQSQEAGKGIAQVDNGLKSRLTTERYPDSGHILIS